MIRCNVIHVHVNNQIFSWQERTCISWKNYFLFIKLRMSLPTYSKRSIYRSSSLLKIISFNLKYRHFKKKPSFSWNLSHLRVEYYTHKQISLSFWFRGNRLDYINFTYTSIIKLISHKEKVKISFKINQCVNYITTIWCICSYSRMNGAVLKGEEHFECQTRVKVSIYWPEKVINCFFFLLNDIRS